ncbi:hypothetical protein PILCRDRAFT_118118 [Piloderma croceum F 1598]|uniref:Uncharacterized protein n=1 Tax=Piloderma croceum (strain F 1598) TaxID=765440 RepID=A0A0C3GP11_PILCF|nr:hypothetical protein PILCRDRAFT_118118 [Piloderma croceum F 1598]
MTLSSSLASSRLFHKETMLERTGSTIQHFEHVIGLTLVAESGFISLVAVLGAFVLILRNAIRSGILIRVSTDIYMLSLFSFDLIAALGTLIYIKWIHDGKVYTGEFCTAEGKSEGSLHIALRSNISLQVL